MSKFVGQSDKKDKIENVTQNKIINRLKLRLATNGNH